MIDWSKSIEDVVGNPVYPISKTFRHRADPNESLIVVQKDRLDRGDSAVYVVDQQGRIAVWFDGSLAEPARRGAPEIRNRKEKKEGWVNLYRDKKGKAFTAGTIHESKEAAIQCKYPHETHIGVDCVEWEE
jgi:hypothetical protein